MEVGFLTPKLFRFVDGVLFGIQHIADPYEKILTDVSTRISMVFALLLVQVVDAIQTVPYIVWNLAGCFFSRQCLYHCSQQCVQLVRMPLEIFVVTNFFALKLCQPVMDILTRILIGKNKFSEQLFFQETCKKPGTYIPILNPEGSYVSSWMKKIDDLYAVAQKVDTKSFLGILYLPYIYLRLAVAAIGLRIFGPGLFILDVLEKYLFAVGLFIGYLCFCVEKDTASTAVYNAIARTYILYRRLPAMARFISNFFGKCLYLWTLQKPQNAIYTTVLPPYFSFPDKPYHCLSFMRERLVK